MPSPRDQLAARLAPWSPRLLDASARGSGWNSVWRLSEGNRLLVLKVYGRRRTRLKEELTDLSNRVSGRTGYTAPARRDTEARCLALWRREGFDVPEPEVTAPAHFPALPAPFLRMEFLPGPTLAEVVGDAAAPFDARASLLASYSAGLAARHARALETREPFLIQEHPDLAHVLVSGSRLCTFDLEVAYTGRGHVEELVSAELAGFVRRLLRTVPGNEADRFLSVLVNAYPARDRLERVWTHLYENPSPVRRLLHAADRRLSESKGRRGKYDAARRLRKALTDSPPFPGTESGPPAPPAKGTGCSRA